MFAAPLLVALLFVAQSAPAPAAPAVSAERFLEHVRWLADDERLGRGTGNSGYRAAADYMAERFAEAGLLPGGDDGSYLQRFDAPMARKLGDGNRLALGGHELELETDWIPFASTASGSASGTLVFAGYGIRDEEGGYDDYSGLDVRGKIVLVLRRGPGASLQRATVVAPGDVAVAAEAVSGERAADDLPGSRYLDSAGPARRLIDFTAKINTAFKQGAAGLIVVNDPATYPPGSAEDVTLAYGSSHAGGVSASLPAVHMRAGAAQSLLEPLGVDLADLQRHIDAQMAPSSFDPATHGSVGPEWQVELKIVAEREQVETWNVVGILRGQGDDSDRSGHLLVGAHLDHLGLAHGSGSLAGDGGRGQVHNGADDNASGSAGLLEIARVLAAAPEPLPKPVVFVAFGAEELGLLGSQYYVEHPALALEDLWAMVNMDMIGRSAEGFLSVEGLGTSPHLRDLVGAAHTAIGAPFALTLSDPVPGNSDQASFAAASVPVVSFFTGLHDDYHRPSDDTDKIAAEAGAQVAGMAAALLVGLAELPERPEFVEPDVPQHETQVKPEPGREVKGYGVYFGSVPDMTYSRDDGVRVSDARAGSPAEACGLKKGDIIVGLAGQAIRNLEDYSVLLFSRRPGETIEIEVLRDGERLTLQATLQAKGGDS